MRLQVLTHETFIFWLLFLHHVFAALVNVTVDDSGVDPMSGNRISYTPAGGWNTKDCDECTAQPNETKMYGQTWHDSTFNRFSGGNSVPNQPLLARFSFTGSALYVICALARTEDHPAGHSDMTFSINDTVVGNFRRNPPVSTGYDYNQTVFSTTTLPFGFHSLTIQNGHVDGEKSLILLDAIIYTYEDGNSSMPAIETSSPPIGAIVGGVLGGLAFLLVLASAYYLYHRQHKRPLEEPRENIIHPVSLGLISQATLHATSGGFKPSAVLSQADTDASSLPTSPSRNEPLAAQQPIFANATMVSGKPSASLAMAATTPLDVIQHGTPPAYSVYNSSESSQ